MAKNTTPPEEKLTEMITSVLSPAMRAHLDHACSVKGNAPYAYLIREALRPWLETNDPISSEELKRITDEWITDHPKGIHHS